MDTTPTLRRRIFEMLMESQYWPPERMLEFQRSQLAQLLRHAKATVPFYKTRLDPVFKSNGEIDWDRWHEIPIVTRADLRDRRNELLATELPPGHGPTKTFHSSGSSGVPIAMEVTQTWTHANHAVAQRFYQLQGLDYREKRAILANTNSAGEVLHEEFYYKKRRHEPSRDLPDTLELVLNRNLTENRKLDLLASEHVAQLSDITNNIEVLAIANLDRKKSVKLETILCFGQGLTVEQRDLFQASFGARSLSIYSSVEGGVMGCQCGDSPHYHLNPETVLVETLTADGKASGANNEGRVIITPFFSTALPLIRYDQDDTAELQQSCACRYQLPVIANITGRQDQFMQFPEGKRSAAGLDQKLLRECLNALAFQIAQIETFRLEVRFVSANPGKAVKTGRLVAHIRERVHPKLEIDFKQVERISLNSRGKLQRIVCEIPA
ncbi:MAG: hypothetical protein Q8L53_15885 [Aestuariivirga sp.]|nr:hypothetical protein [Aestuariivirga sp.]